MRGTRQSRTLSTRQPQTMQRRSCDRIRGTMRAAKTVFGSRQSHSLCRASAVPVSGADKEPNRRDIMKRGTSDTLPQSRAPHDKRGTPLLKPPEDGGRRPRPCGLRTHDACALRQEQQRLPKLAAADRCQVRERDPDEELLDSASRQRGKRKRLAEARAQKHSQSRRQRLRPLR